ncbi:SAC3/GANP/Nin1/mts3/eIF-3 p25 family-domain-containing protein [Myxozyma melibiosi]|uniref:SAC3/GANP/Nin1/mts3/eIF-3 p25 family-domain-containing protein n=1 Tax=Myxozyma melibiosi TaxID=54550 RepID=A0ABR1F4E4_9ASCO
MSSHTLEARAHELAAAFSAKDYEKCATLLPPLKLMLAQLNILVPLPSSDPSLLVLARDILEIGALTSIFLRDDVLFSRYVAQLSSFYALKDKLSPPSVNEKKLIALRLLLLLSRNDIAEFHTDLETLEDEADTDQYIRYPVMLERWLMEGSYDKVWKATTQRSEVPAEEFAIFADILVDTIRSEIATCSEKAYPSLPLANAQHLLFFSDESELKDFIEQRGWTVENGRIYFPQEEPDALQNGVAMESIIENTLGYARELETIV